MIWGGFSVDIWTERLERWHLPILANWIGRTSGAMTPNDLPKNAEELSQWYEISSADPGRQYFLILVYDTPVGLAGLRQHDGRGEILELYLQLYEINYNPLRTATYATLRILDRAFLDSKTKRVETRVFVQQRDYLEALERMGFSRTAADNEIICVAVDKDPYLSRKYLF